MATRMSDERPSNAGGRDAPCSGIRIDRRALLVGGSLAAAGLLTGSCRKLGRRGRSPVFVAGRQTYDGPLVATLRDGLIAGGLDLAAMRGKRVLLKPNLVEPTRAAPYVTTDPRVVRAAADVFRSAGAHVVVGEGPGHVRDTDMALDASGLNAVLVEDRIPFADLNYEETGWRPNSGRTSRLDGFHFPRSVLEADLIVSMPKMKTHHWTGVTASLKNLYGTIPGIRYGWPKNVLHHAGIPQSVFDINASLPRMIAIVDGIECMEGDGPIMGTPKPMGAIVVGTNGAAVDATVCRLMGVAPERIGYLALAADRLGPIDAARIEPRGDDWRTLARPFTLLDVPHLHGLRLGEPGSGTP
ncbi:MAG: DUF362 domain-containing protein [Planctomycetes bacterium]|nr:DUF362 domain-containing protein [Planctomycetota bacterium]